MITINHRETLPWHAGLTIRDVLTAMKYSYPHIIVSINAQLVPYDAYDTTPVPDKAEVLIVHLTAGG